MSDNPFKENIKKSKKVLKELDDFTKQRDLYYDKLIWNDNTKEDENEMKNYIAKKTEKIRYKLASLVIKHLTPVLYKKLDIKTFTNRGLVQFKTDNISDTVLSTD